MSALAIHARQRPLRILRPGRVPYADALDLQARLKAERADGACPDTVVLLEHPPTITLGRAAKVENVLLPRDHLARQGVTVHEIDRGGDVTWHGPGQLVAYPIFDLAPDRQDVRRYVTNLEEVMIRTAADFGLVAGRKEKMNGTWLGGEISEGAWRKIGAVGVHISRWITSHGLAFNVDPDLSGFSLIVPCGIRDHGVTSLARELDRPVDLAEAADRMAEHFLAVFEARRVE